MKLWPEKSIRKIFSIEVLPQAIQIVKSIQYAFVREPFEGDIKAHWNFWKHQDFALQRIQNKDVPYLSRSELEGAATESSIPHFDLERLIAS